MDFKVDKGMTCGSEEEEEGILDYRWHEGMASGESYERTSGKRML